MNKPEPMKEHHWLKQLLGEWTYEMEGEARSEGEAEMMTGTEMCYPIGELWVQIEQNAVSSDAGISKSLITLGFDPAKQKFVGTFISSDIDFMWHYEGTLDESGTRLTLDTEGPTFEDPSKRQPYQDIIEIVSPTQRNLISRSKGPDGQWQEFMKMVVSRAL